MTSTRKTEDHLAGLKRAELLGLAGELQLKVSNRMRKDELRRALRNVPGIDALVDALRDGQPAAPARADSLSQKRSVRAAAGGAAGATAVAAVRGSASGAEPGAARTSSGAVRRVSAPGVPVTESRLLLMAIGPSAAHAYWQVEPRVLELARRWLGELEGVQVLRFSDLARRGSGEMGETFDIEIDGEEGSYYLNTWSPGRVLVAELGLRSSDGRFVVVTRSNEVALPADAESERYETTTRRLHRPVSSLWKARRSSPEAVASEEIDKAEASVHDAAGVPGGSAREQHGLDASTSVATPGYEPAGGVGRPLDVRGGGPLQVPGDWESAVGTSSGELVGSSFSSQSLLDRDGALKVSIQAHLVVRGRTQPGTELSIEGVPVPVQSDGTFQLCFSVPAPGAESGVELPVERRESDSDDAAGTPDTETS